MKNILTLFVLCFTYGFSLSQIDQTLFQTLKEKDSLLFELGFNQCDSVIRKELTSKDLEFYHDQSGITTSQKVFLESMKNICNLSYKPVRKLVEGSLKAYPLKNNGELYGAYQTGEHEFYAIEEGKEMYMTSTAKFSHLWILEDDQWKVKRVISYDHQPSK